MVKNVIKSAVILTCMFSSFGVSAGLITSNGAVNALTDISQMAGSLFVADFNDGPVNTNMPLNIYSAQGMTFHQGALSAALAGVTTPGSGSTPGYRNYLSSFSGTIAGGGSVTGLQARVAGVATFDVDITQFGLTAGQNGTQYLVAWDTLGNLLGQVTWTPSFDSSFVGIDTLGVNIGMIAYGNDDLFNGATYSIGGATIMSDNWMWAVTPVSVPEPITLSFFGLGLAGLGFARRKKG